MPEVTQIILDQLRTMDEKQDRHREEYLRSQTKTETLLTGLVGESGTNGEFGKLKGTVKELHDWKTSMTARIAVWGTIAVAIIGLLGSAAHALWDKVIR